MFGGGGQSEYTGSIAANPTEPVQSGALAAPGQSGNGSSYPNTSYGGGGGVQSSPLDSPASGQPMYGQQGQGQGQPAGLSSDGRVVTLGPGDNLDAISRRFAIPRQALMDVNGIRDANAVRPGQQLLVPVYSRSKGGWVAPDMSGAQAPQMSGGQTYPTSPQPSSSFGDTQPATAAAQSPGRSGSTQAGGQGSGRHRVQPGETVYSIGRQYNVSPNAIISANGLSDPNNVRIGTDLVIPGASGQVASASQGQPAAQSAPQQTQPAQLGEPPRSLQEQAQTLQAAPSQPAASQQQTQQSQAPAQQPAAQQPQAPQQQQVAMAPASGQQNADSGVQSTQAMSSGMFRWPVRGRVISGFGDKASGGKNDGINISVPEGTAIRAAEEGTVAYAGNELKGYGNLVLVRHKDDWVTAYAHNSEILVQRGDTVSRGQVIAKAGQSGSVNAPQLHFEVRRNSTPVDPMKYLAEN
ncbi:Membrane protein [Lutibaculum baratangense AMV1]|uniref:Membrane protein n=2 Tax=Lutibaculum TaxID=1358438 RepID=V4RBM2_9HYPH|nr:Membrane protein [Lutibaculum baratangense AMV1]